MIHGDHLQTDGMNVWSVDLNSLRALHALLDTASVTQAATRLGITQPAASAALARLRTLFDDPLLVRSGRGMIRSSRGEELLVQTRAFLGAAERVLTPAASLAPATFSWTVRVAASDHVAAVLLGPLDAMLRQSAPGVNLRMMATGADPLADLARGDMDLLVGPYESRRTDLHRTTLYDDRFVCVMRRGHPLAATDATLESLAAMEHVQVQATERDVDPFDSVLVAAGMSRRVSRRVPSCWLGAALVADTDLVMVVPRSIALTVSAALPLVVRDLPVEPASVRVHAVWHDRVADDTRFGWFLGQVRAALG
jgi:DNA-binding transcriptional LysR family regulator